MTNFERGKSPKETIKIGLEAHAIPIKGAGYIMHGKDVWLEDNQMPDFMDRITRMDFPKDFIFGPQTVFIRTEEGGIMELDEIAARGIKWKGKFALVPTLPEIADKGFEYMLENSKSHRHHTLNLKDLERLKIALPSSNHDYKFQPRTMNEIRVQNGYGTICGDINNLM